jgi:hypothetical protein
MKHVKLFETFINEETFKGEKGLSLNVQHDYITLKMPIGNYTYGRYGAKTSGQLVSMPGAFKAIDDYVYNKEDKRPLLDRFKELLKPKVMDKLVPGWDKPKVVNISVGDNVLFADDFMAKRYPDKYKVELIKGKFAYLKVPKKGGGTETVGFQLHSVEKTK